MKRIILFFVAISLVLTACTAKPASEEAVVPQLTGEPSWTQYSSSDNRVNISLPFEASKSNFEEERYVDSSYSATNGLYCFVFVERKYKNGIDKGIEEFIDDYKKEYPNFVKGEKTMIGSIPAINVLFITDKTDSSMRSITKLRAFIYKDTMYLYGVALFDEKLSDIPQNAVIEDFWGRVAFK